MKIKRFQIWRKVVYGDFRKFRYWSPRIWGERDRSLTIESPRKDWKKIIVLKPIISPPGTIFSIGFITVSGHVEVSTVTRKVEDGPFGMRMGPDDCGFFIVSNEGEVWLSFVEYADISDKLKSDIPVY